MAEATETEPLVEKVYYEGCPGCAVERKLNERGSDRLPMKEFILGWVCTLGTTLPISSLFPFLYFMIRDLHIAKRTEDIGFYAGFVGASFMIGRALTSTPWGIVADRIGRKPVFLFGLFSIVIFNTLFGLSVNYWMAIVSRFLTGALNGLLGPIKAYMIEVCRPEHHATALSLITTSWGIGLIIGPAIGGYLAQPAEKFPQLFSPESIFGRFPYFLPCLIISIAAGAAFIVCLCLPETLHKHGSKENEVKTIENLEAESCLYDSQDTKQKHSSSANESLLKNWPLMSSIIVYCIYCFHDMAYSEIFSLWAESDRKLGGLSYTTEDVGQVLAISGFALLVYQIFIYPSVVKYIGILNSCRISSVLALLLLAAYPLIGSLSGFALSIVLNIASLLKNVLSVTILTCFFIMQNNAVPQNQRGAANGIAMTGNSFARAIAPAVAGVIFSWTQKRLNASILPGSQMVFFLLNVPQLLGFIMTFKPFLAIPNQAQFN